MLFRSQRAALLRLAQALGVAEDVALPGFVGNPYAWMARAAVFVLSSRWEGFSNALAEALAVGCPVVSTSIGAEGLNAQDNVHMLMRDTPQSFAQAVLDLLAQPEKGAQIGVAGREWVLATHAWSHSAALLKDAYAALLNR